MARLTPIWCSDATSAALLDMAVSEFRALVAAGCLPDGQEIAPGVKRWNFELLRSLATGKLHRPDGGLEL